MLGYSFLDPKQTVTTFALKINEYQISSSWLTIGY